MEGLIGSSPDVDLNHHLSANIERSDQSSPISGLPNEILVMIFDMALHETEERYYDVLHSLACVSSRWAAIALQSSSLWGYVHSTHLPSLYKRALTKFPNSPLDFKFDDRRGYTSIVAFGDAILDQARRWRSAKFRSIDSASDLLLSKLSDANAASLEELVIDCSGNECDVDVVDVFGGKADRLRALSLLGFSVPWGSGILTHLRTLAVSHTAGQLPPTRQQVAAILQACPELERLDLESCEPLLDKTSAAETLTPISLPQLASFRLALDPGTMHHVISRVRIPACKRFFLASDQAVTTMFSHATAHLAPVFASLVAGAVSMAVSISTSTLSLSIRKGYNFNNEVLSLNFPDFPSALPSYTWLLDHLQVAPTRPTVTLYQSGESEWFTPRDVMVILSKLTFVETLQLHGSSPVIQLLATPSMDPLGGRLCWPLPNLRRLVFRGAGRFDVQAISYMVECRLAEGDGWRTVCRDRPDVGHAAVQLPVKLDVLDLTGFAFRNDDDLRACERLAAMVREVWWGTAGAVFAANA